MSQTKTKTAENLNLEMPPTGGDLSAAAESLEEEAHALRVMLDKSENFKVAIGQNLLRLLKTRFNGNRNALRDWYEAEVVQGKAHRSWSSVEDYLGAVNAHGERAAEVLAQRAELDRQRRRQAHQRDRAIITEARHGAEESSNINRLREAPGEPKSEYEQRKQWLSQMDYHWFRGKPEWRKKWLSDRNLTVAV